MTNTIKTNLFYGAVTILILAFMYLLGASATRVGATAGFLPATVATSSNPTVTSTAGTLFATSTCVSRIITTSASPVMLTFSDYAGQTPTGSFGHLQSASTTVVYDGGQYGCGLVKAYSFTSQVVTVTETR